MKNELYDLKIRQSYHGTGGKEGYKFKLYDQKGKKLGELEDVPLECEVGHTVTINGNHYIVTEIYESPLPREERSEVIYYELKKYEFRTDFDLEMATGKEKNVKKKMKPKFLNGKWHVEVETEEFGNVLLLEKGNSLAIPATFKSKEEALKFIKSAKIEEL